MPPIRNKKPMTRAIRNLLLPAIKAATTAPTSVPKACARNGNKKCLGSNKGKAAFNPSGVVTSAPTGAGMMEVLIIIRLMLTTLPTMAPASTARTLRTIGFIGISFDVLIYY